MKSSFVASSPTRTTPTAIRAQGHELAIGCTCSFAVVRYADGGMNEFQPNRVPKMRTLPGDAATGTIRTGTCAFLSAIPSATSGSSSAELSLRSLMRRSEPCVTWARRSASAPMRSPAEILVPALN